MRRIFFLLLIIAACSPEKRLARLLEKNPQLVKNDTVSVVKFDTIAGQDFSFTVDRDSIISVDTVFLTSKDTVCNREMKRAKAEIIRLRSALMRPLIKDTITRVDGTTIIKLFANGNDIGVRVIRPQVVNAYTVTTIGNIIACPPLVISFWWKLGWGLAVFLFLLILAVLYVYEKGKH